MANSHKRPIHLSEPSATEEELLNLLEQKILGGFSKEGWRDHRHLAGQPVYEKRLCILQHNILDELPISRPMRRLPGAYIPLEPLFNHVVRLFDVQRRFHFSPLSPSRASLWKFSADNRYVFGKKNEGFFFQPLDVFDAQCVSHVHSYGVARTDESNEALRAAFVEMDMNTFLQSLPTQAVQLHDRVLYCDYIYVADWVTHVRELNLEAPNAADPEAEPCFGCFITKDVLKVEWLKDPFAVHRMTRTTQDCPRSVLPSVEMWRRRYCWLHGVTRMLSATLSNLYHLLPQRSADTRAMVAICQQYQETWQPDGKPAALVAKNAKKMIRTGIAAEVSKLYSNTDKRTLTWPVAPKEWQVTEQQAALAVLDAIRVFHDFAYTKWPSAQAYEALWEARNGLLSVYAANKWQLTPTIHFMTNEAIDLAKMDGTAYFSLQESIEHQNKVDKRDVKKTKPSPETQKAGKSSWQQMLDLQQLRRSVTAKRQLVESSSSPPNSSTSKSDVIPTAVQHKGN
jgi:hypothetical protein